MCVQQWQYDTTLLMFPNVLNSNHARRDSGFSFSPDARFRPMYLDLTPISQKKIDLDCYFARQRISLF